MTLFERRSFAHFTANVRPQNDMTLRFALICLFLTLCARVYAADDAHALAVRFVDLLRYEDQFAIYQEQCVATQRTVSAEALVARNPDYFGGIRPDHKKWPAVTAAYEAYFKEACARPTKTEFLAALSSSYEHAMTPRQLRTAIKFYSSETGKSLVAANKKAYTAVYESWRGINSQHLADITAKFQRQITLLVQSK